MRTPDLFRRDVLGPDGGWLGRVVDVRLVGDLAGRGGALPGLRVDGVIVSPRQGAALWGYDRHAQQGPWLLRTLVRWWHRDGRYAEWDSVVWADEGPLRLTRNPRPLPPLDRRS